MRVSAALVASTLAASVAAADKAYLGFNSGSRKDDDSAKVKSDFLAEFNTAQNLKNAPGTFNAVRLYTNIQAGTESDPQPISAFEAAIETKTYILLGVWASGTDNIDAELNALQAGIDKYGKKLTDLIIGMSIGSEDLYRDSVTGRINKSGVGNSPEAIVNFIKEYRQKFAKTLANVPVGHVDTWDVWQNASAKAVVDAVDWVGVDEYPYYENGKGNNIKNSGQLFDRAYDIVEASVGDKPIWVTETGWPYVGEDWDEAVASVKNAKYYWDEVGCRKLFNKVPTFWYNLRDSNSANTMKFSITDKLSTTPRFDLSCPDTFETPEKSDETSTSAPAPTKSGSESATTGAPTASGTSAGSGADPTTSTAPPTNTPGDEGNAASSLGMLAPAAYAGVAIVAGLLAFY